MAILRGNEDERVDDEKSQVPDLPSDFIGLDYVVVHSVFSGHSLGKNTIRVGQTKNVGGSHWTELAKSCPGACH